MQVFFPKSSLAKCWVSFVRADDGYKATRLQRGTTGPRQRVGKIREIHCDFETELEALTSKFSGWYQSMIENHEIHGMEATSLRMKEGERDRALQNKSLHYEQQYSSNDSVQYEYQGELTEMTVMIY